MGVNAISWAPVTTLEDLNPDENANNMTEYPRLVTGSCDETIKIWTYNKINGQFDEMHTLKGHTKWVRDVAWCPALGNPYDLIASASEDQTVRIWRITRDKNIESEVIGKFDGPVWRVSWSLTGSMLAISCAS
jgi:protein transport protein SEC13